MEGSGQLSGSLAHDLNNLLAIIQGYVCMLQNNDCPDENRPTRLPML